MSVILDFVCALSVNKGFTVFQNVLLSAMSRVLILLKKFFFSHLNKFTRRLRYLLHAYLSMSFFVFKTLFLSCDLFMISTFFVLFIKETWFARTYRCFIGACLWIVLLWKDQTHSRCFQRSLEISYSAININTSLEKCL